MEWIKILLVIVFTIQLAQNRVVYLSELFRHGSRYPTHDVIDKNSTEPFKGQLTGVGMRQHYLLGGFLKKDYQEQLDLTQYLQGNEVEVFSDGTQRCVESAYAHMAGWFPLGSGPNIPDVIPTSLLEPPFKRLSTNNLRFEPAL